MRKTSWKEIFKRNEVIPYVPGDARFIDIAEERTAGMVNTFREAVTRLPWLKVHEAIGTLARSAYIQGVRDTCDAAAQLKLSKPEKS